MKKIGKTFAILAVILPASAGLGAQEISTARAIVTANARSAEDAVTVPRQTISVLENRKLQQVTGWVPLRGERSGLQLVILLDDAARSNLGLQINDLRRRKAGVAGNPGKNQPAQHQA